MGKKRKIARKIVKTRTVMRWGEGGLICVKID